MACSPSMCSDRARESIQNRCHPPNVAALRRSSGGTIVSGSLFGADRSPPVPAVCNRPPAWNTASVRDLFRLIRFRAGKLGLGRKPHALSEDYQNERIGKCPDPFARRPAWPTCIDSHAGSLVQRLALSYFGVQRVACSVAATIADSATPPCSTEQLVNRAGPVAAPSGSAPARPSSTAQRPSGSARHAQPAYS